MYTYIFRSPTCQTSGTGGTLLPFFSLQAGARAVALTGLKFDTAYTNLFYSLVVRRSSAQTTGGSVLTPFPFTLDLTTNPLFTLKNSTSGGLTATNFMAGDKEVFEQASNAVGLTEWNDGDITALSLAPNDKGCIDIYVASPTVSANFVATLFVSET